MDRKAVMIIAGGVMIAVGAFALLTPGVSGVLVAAVLVAGGAAFLRYYRRRRALWGLALAAYLIYAGVGGLIWLRINGAITWPFVAATALFVPSALCFALWKNKGLDRLLPPACLLWWLGVFVYLNGFFVFVHNTAALCLACLALGSANTGLLGRRTFGGKPFALAGGLALAGVFMYEGFGLAAAVRYYLPVAIPGALIAGGVGLVLYARRKGLGR